MDRIRVARSARKHRVSNAHVHEALLNETARSEDGDALRTMGTDVRGVELELELVLVPDDRFDGWTIIYAMPTTYRRNR